MATYKIIHNQLPDIPSMSFPKKCNKVTQGCFEYTIDDQYMLMIDNGDQGSVRKSIDLKFIILNLTSKKEIEGAKNFLSNVLTSGDNNNAAFICAVLRDLGNISVS